MFPSISLYATRSLICFILSFLILIIYFSLLKPEYILDKNKYDRISIRLILIYSLLFSSAIALGFMFLDIVYNYYFNQSITINS